ncbi:MAG: hypothetical protein JOZ14_01665 [Acidobacteria bacterium]|nr:hypothetical protein [Acidobacteriota bacterium]
MPLKQLFHVPFFNHDGALLANIYSGLVPRMTYCHTHDMFYHMKTTLNIDDTVMAQLKREAVRQRRTMSELVETALRMLFRASKRRGRVPPLPLFRSGGTLADVADRDALYRVMEER